jgi:hypothetical protein
MGAGKKSSNVKVPVTTMHAGDTEARASSRSHALPVRNQSRSHSSSGDGDDGGGDRDGVAHGGDGGAIQGRRSRSSSYPPPPSGFISGLHINLSKQVLDDALKGSTSDDSIVILVTTPYLAMFIMITCGLLFGFLEAYIWVNSARHARTEKLSSGGNRCVEKEGEGVGAGGGGVML